MLIAEILVPEMSRFSSNGRPKGASMAPWRPRQLPIVKEVRLRSCPRGGNAPDTLRPKRERILRFTRFESAGITPEKGIPTTAIVLRVALLNRAVGRFPVNSGQSAR
jgi:hypothetical protein